MIQRRLAAGTLTVDQSVLPIRSVRYWYSNDRTSVPPLNRTMTTIPIVAFFLLQIEQLHLTIFANSLTVELISASTDPQ